MYESLAIVLVAGQFAAVLALWTGILTTLGQAKVAAAAVESVARQPEARGPIMTNMIIGCGFAETGGVYGFVIAIILLFGNPLVNHAVNLIG